MDQEVVIGGAWCYLPPGWERRLIRGVSRAWSRGGAWRGRTRPLSFWTDSGRGWQGRVEELSQAAQSDADWGAS